MTDEKLIADLEKLERRMVREVVSVWKTKGYPNKKLRKRGQAISMASTALSLARQILTALEEK